MNSNALLRSVRMAGLSIVLVFFAWGTTPVIGNDDLVLRLTELDPPPIALLAAPGDRVLIGVLGDEFGSEPPTWALITDGTPRGTEPVSATFPDGTPVIPYNTWRMGDALYARKAWVEGGGSFGAIYYHAALHRVALNASSSEILVFTPQTGSFSSPNYPMSLPAIIGDRMFFFGVIDSHPGPCVSDGTTAGTRAVPLLDGNLRCTWIGKFVETPQYVYFSGEARDGANNFLGYGLWRTDREGSGAELLGIVSAPPRALVAAGERVFFTVRNWSEDVLYMADASPLEASPFEDVVFDGDEYDFGREGILGVLNDEVYFVRTDETGRRLWRANGLPGGSVSIREAGSSRATGWDPMLMQHEDRFTGWEVFDGKLLFRMRPDDSWQLWATDGTESGTFMVADAGAMGGPRGPLGAGNRLYFDRGERLHRSTGTSGSEVEISSVQLDYLPNFTFVRNRLFFLAKDAPSAEKQVYIAYYLPEEPDRDGDGVPDFLDAFPDDPRYSLDEDGDGLPDEWELYWFGDLETADRYSDFTGDGITDYLAFILDISPFETHKVPSLSAPFFE